jgi:hypothetical protein
MKLYYHSQLALLIFVIFLMGCASETDNNPAAPPDSTMPVSIEALEIVSGQTIYVPAYSEIYFWNNRKINLAITLSVRNTDLQHPIVLTSVRYYDTHGELVREYLPQATQLGAMASTDFFVDEHDDAGGVGANFIVEWVAEEPVHEPVVEAVMLSSASNQGISFISPGRVISQTAASLGE